ncbi:MAG: septum formation initiator family protein [Lachnoclostridium sp.]|nr:septum formation initiator family protein [Lachnoclostridium sp.]
MIQRKRNEIRKNEPVNKTYRKRKRRKNRTLLYAIVAVALVMSSVLFMKRNELYTDYKLQVDQVNDLKEKMQKLQEEKKEIEAKAAYVQTPQYIEDMAREKLGLVYEDEIIFEPKE